MLSKEELAEIKASCDATGEGAWVAVDRTEDCILPAGVFIAVQRAEEPYKTIGRICEMAAQGIGGKYSSEKSNAVTQFIAHSKSDIPKLLAHIKILEMALSAACWHSYYMALKHGGGTEFDGDERARQLIQTCQQEQEVKEDAETNSD